ncbi:hypothetical protein EJ04DRAFT_250906 [Polyplosphaeria fusca]|uniref:Uncharacterized protein n=1 Tax=Polyplosphaeria fusca TaxID=682080 RepID=A0A9P4V153_9PLEO|nr:hypothetical protein EJ04DRAFT_250906 [Polyplosphaeria fusca]
MLLFRLPCALFPLIAVDVVCALLPRDLPLHNATTSTITASTSTDIAFFKPHVENSATITDLQPEETLQPNVVPSSTATLSDMIRSSRAYKPHVEDSASISEFGIVTTPETTPTAAVQPSTTVPPDVGSIIVSIFHPGGNSFVAHIENSETGLPADATTSPGPQSTKNDPVTTSPPTVTYDGHVLTPTSGTKLVVGGTTIGPGQTATIGQGPSATYVDISPNGNPRVVVGGTTSTIDSIPSGPVRLGDYFAQPITSGLVIDSQTVTHGGAPITIGSPAAPTVISIDEHGQTLEVVGGTTSTLLAPATQAFIIGDVTATAIRDDPAYAVGSTVLAVGQPVTIDNTAYELTTNEAGSTVLIAGSSSTTLAAPTDLSISTMIVSGITQYVIEGQTLFPGHPITIADTPISLTTSSGSTILAIGNMTTTLPSQPRTSAPAAQTTPSRTTWTSTSDGGNAQSSGTIASAKPTSGAHAPSSHHTVLILLALTVVTFALHLT